MSRTNRSLIVTNHNPEVISITSVFDDDYEVWRVNAKIKKKVLIK